MEQILASRYTLEAARIATGSEDQRGVIVRVDGQITAIFVKLSASCHESLRGSWYLEAGFGPCAGGPQPFEHLAEGLAWIGSRLKDPSTDLLGFFTRLEAAFTKAETGIEVKQQDL